MNRTPLLQGLVPGTKDFAGDTVEAQTEQVGAAAGVGPPVPGRQSSCRARQAVARMGSGGAPALGSTQSGCQLQVVANLIIQAPLLHPPCSLPCHPHPNRTLCRRTPQTRLPRSWVVANLGAFTGWPRRTSLISVLCCCTTPSCYSEPRFTLPCTAVR